MPVEFTCPDCGWHIVNVVDSIPAVRCLSCEWIHDVPDPADRAHLRAAFCIPPPSVARFPPPPEIGGDGASVGAVPRCQSPLEPFGAA